MVQGLRSEVHATFVRDLLEGKPRLVDAIAVNRVVEVPADVIRQGENGPRGLDWTAGALEAPESLAQRVERRCLRNHAVEIEIHSDFETLRRDDEHGSGLLTAGRLGAGVERPEAFWQSDLDPPPSRDRSSGWIPNRRPSPESGGFDAPALPDSPPPRRRVRPTRTSEASPRPAWPSWRKPRLALRCRRPLQAWTSLLAPMRDFNTGWDRSSGPSVNRFRASAPGVAVSRTVRVLRPADLTHRVQRLSKRFREMRLVQQHECSLTEQAGMDGTHRVRYAIATEQETGTHLVDGRAEDGRLGRRASPYVFQRCSPAEPSGDQRRSVPSSQLPEPVTNFFRYCAAGCQFSRPTERLGNSGRPFVRAVHDEAPVHDESDADRSVLWLVGAKSEVENSGIKGRCLPRRGWKVENVGPLVIVGQ